MSRNSNISLQKSFPTPRVHQFMFVYLRRHSFTSLIPMVLPSHQLDLVTELRRAKVLWKHYAIQFQLEFLFTRFIFRKHYAKLI